MSPLPPSGLASDLLEGLEPVDPTDPQRLASFVDRLGQAANRGAVEVEPHVHLVVFALAGELFAVAVERVREVIRAHDITRVPQAPEHVRGVQNMRGSILPVLEIRTRLGLPPSELTAASRVLVVEARSRLIGLLVDTVLQVARVKRSAISAPPAEVRSTLSQHIESLARVDGRTALLLELDKLLLLNDHEAPSPPAASPPGGSAQEGKAPR